MSGLAAAQSVLGRLQQSVINPVVRLAWDLGIPIRATPSWRRPGIDLDSE